MDEIQSPHDKFVKEFFSKNDNAISFFKANLPSHVLKHIDFDTLSPKKDSFIDQELSEYFADYLFSIGFKDESLGYIYILLEHKSYQDVSTDFQLLKYMVRIWETVQKEQKGENFPVIIPLVLYHGKDKWRYSIEFKQHFQCPEDLEVYIPNFQYVLWDASQLNDGEILGGIILKVFSLILKYVQQNEIDEKLPEIFQLLAQLSEKSTAIEYLEIILRYLANTIPEDKVPFEELKNMITNSFSNKGGELMATIADVLRNEGREKWMQQGIQQGVQRGIQQGIQQGVQRGIQQGVQQGVQQGIIQTEKENIIDILETRFGEISNNIRDKINSFADPAPLKNVLKKAVMVSSLEEFEKQFHGHH